jgi:aminopeptidase
MPAAPAKRCPGRPNRVLNKGKRTRITGKETDFSFSLKGRTWEIADGRLNMPDGEIMTSPVEDTIDGQILFDFPGVLRGHLVHDIKLRWESGELVEASSSTNQDLLRSVLNTDLGASLICKFAIGTKPGIKPFCKDILLDEKIDRTVHIAMGRSYTSVGGTNQSAIHWDIDKNIRQEGEIYLDGDLIYEKGKVIL